MRQLLLVFSLFIIYPVIAQQSVNLEDCYDLVRVNYPLAKQKSFLQTQNELDREVILNQTLPSFNFAAQATYQSDVVEIAIPNVNITPLNKDQYKATFLVNQLIYNAGTTKASLGVIESELKTKEKQIEVSLYQLKLRVNQLFFSVLLAQENKLLLEAKEKQLAVKLKEVQSGVKYGELLPASDKVLEAELLKVKQQLREVEKNKTLLSETLFSLIGTSFNSTIEVESPITQITNDSVIRRPEIDLFQIKKEGIQSSETLLSKKNAPKLYGFAQGGYGNPGLNILDNSFQPFYIVGVKLNWQVFDWNSNKKQRKSLAIHKDIIDNEEAIFKLNTNIELNQQQKEIEKIADFIASDKEIIVLRKEVLKTANSQLKNGVITSSAYITELTNLYSDENMLVRHKIQLQLAKANYNVIKGQ